MSGALFLFRDNVPSTPDDKFPLQPGRYLINVYLDRDRRTTADPAVLLGPEALVGQIEIEAQWRIGFPHAETFSANELKQ